MVSGGMGNKAFNNRMSMYRRTPAVGDRGSQSFTNKKSLTIYNPFAFNASSINQVKNEIRASFGTKGPASKDNKMSRSIDDLKLMMQSNPKKILTDNNSPQIELIYQAMKKAQLAW